MYWRMTGLSTASPVESVLDKDTYSLEELLDEDEIIQECKSLNNRLINFLRGKAQVQQLLRYVIEEPKEENENNRAYKFPFIACEIFTCEIDAIYKTLVENDELMAFLFSFLDADHAHGTLLAGYFSKVVICLLLRKTVAVMHYLQVHREILGKLVDLIGTTSIMEVLIRLVGADDHISTFHADALQWLADTDLLEMLADKLRPPNSSEVHANASETLSAVTQLTHSTLATRLSSPSFVGKLFYHALEEPKCKSTLIHSLSVCISLLDPKRAATVAAVEASRGQLISEPLSTANPEMVDGMLQRLGDLLQLLDVSVDESVLPATYGELKPPLGTHRLKIVEFIAVLLRTNNEGAKQELVRLGAIQIVMKLFFDYPFNNMLHHHVENIMTTCIESSNKLLIDHLFTDCDLIARLLATDQNPIILSTQTMPTVPAISKTPLRTGNLGHLTRIANKLVQVGNMNLEVQSQLQGNPKWVEWQSSVLENRNSMENVFQWKCGRPTSLQDRPVDSDEDDFHARDYDVSTMASNLTREVFQYGMFDSEDVDEGHGAIARDDDDIFFDDESAEVVISSLQLGDEQDSSGRIKENMFMNSNWFPFQDERSKQSMPTFLIASSSSRLEDKQGNDIKISSPSSSSSDDEVVVGEDDELLDTASSSCDPSFQAEFGNGPEQNGIGLGGSRKGPGVNSIEHLSLELEKVGITDNLSFFGSDGKNIDLFSGKPPDWVGWRECSPLQGTSERMAFSRNNPFEVDMEGSTETMGISSFSLPEQVSEVEMDVASDADAEADGSILQLHHNKLGDEPVASLLGGSIQFTGVEVDGTSKAMEHALREGIVREAGPIRPHGTISQTDLGMRPNDGLGDPDLNDVNYWRNDHGRLVTKEEAI